MKQTVGHQAILNNQKGFTLIELIVVIVILGILAVVAAPKYSDMQTEAAEAAAEGVFGACQGAASINFAAGLVGKAAADRPAYDATHCSGGMIVTTTADPNIGGRCLMNALDGDPEGWTVSGATITTTINSNTYTITITTGETTAAKAVLTKTGF
jgi:MSHA pilin protein MshA